MICIGDGWAEAVMKTADGTINVKGYATEDSSKELLNQSGCKEEIMPGPGNKSYLHSLHYQGQQLITTFLSG